MAPLQNQGGCRGLDPNCEQLTSEAAEQNRPRLTFGGTFGAQPPGTSRATTQVVRRLVAPPARLQNSAAADPPLEPPPEPLGPPEAPERLPAQGPVPARNCPEQPAAGRDRLAGQIDHPIDGIAGDVGRPSRNGREGREHVADEAAARRFDRGGVRRSRIDGHGRQRRGGPRHRDGRPRRRPRSQRRGRGAAEQVRGGTLAQAPAARAGPAARGSGGAGGTGVTAATAGRTASGRGFASGTMTWAQLPGERKPGGSS